MSSSSDEEFIRYHRRYPLHDAAEVGDIETLSKILRPRLLKKSASIAAAAEGGAETGAGAEGGDVAPMDEDGGVTATAGTGDGEDGSGAGKAGQGQTDGNATADNNNNTNSHPGEDSSDVDEDDFRQSSVDIEERDMDGCTPLHVALTAKKLDAVKLLLECGAGTTRRLEGSTPAHIALSVASVGKHRGFADAALKLLLEYNHDVSVKDDRGQTLLHLAASFGLEDAIATLLQVEGGRELMESKERLSCRPLHLAALGGHVGATRALIEAGCDASFTNLHGNTALHLACAKARWGVARVLLDLGKASVVACNKSKQTPTAAALKQGLRIPDSLPELQRAAARSGGGGTADSDTKGSGGVPNASSEEERDSSSQNNEAEEARRESPVAGGSGRGSTAAAAVVGGGDVKQWAEGQPGEAAADPPTAGRSYGGEDSSDARAVAPAAATAVPQARTAVLHHPLCLEHHSCAPISRSGSDPPPDNVRRLEVIYNEDSGVLRADEFASLEWDSNPRRADLADVLRVHDYDYVKRLERLCASIPHLPGALGHLDGDTAVSHKSFEAAMCAAGSVCDAVDRVMTGRNRNVFCAVRPPGHHAGYRGLVTCSNDGQGSHGFCLLNNVAIGAAYARCVHRHTGVDRVAIVDFDVHHGNGTEDIVKALVPRLEEVKFKTMICQGVFSQVKHNPWLNEEDPEKCLFVSVHGYGLKERGVPSTYFYPGSGETTDCPIPEARPAAGASEGGEGVGVGDGNGVESAAAAAWPGGVSSTEREPLVLDVGMPQSEPDDTPGASRHRWRDVYRKDILPKLVAFKPDIILVSAGFDAHKKDAINYGYIGLLEEDYEWVTQQLVQVANRCCEGRLVSVLEGGYRIQGGIVSAFGRSVAAHVRAMVDGCESRQEWSASDAVWESNFEVRLLQERERKRKLRLEQQLQAMEDKQYQLRMAMFKQQEQRGGANGDVTPGGQPSTGPPADGSGSELTSAGERESLLPKRGEGPGGAGEEVALPSKRRRTNVDYVALQKKLQEEETLRKAMHTKTTGQASPAATDTGPTLPTADA